MSDQSKRKAKEIIERKSSIPLEGESFEEIEKAYELAVFALEQRIEETPSFNKDTHTLRCPYCDNGYYLFNKDRERNRFCGYCGKKISWTSIPTDADEDAKSSQIRLTDLEREQPVLSTAAYNCIMRSYSRSKAANIPLLHEAHICDFLKAVKPLEFFQTRGVGRKIYEEVANYLNLNFKANWPRNMNYK